MFLKQMKVLFVIWIDGTVYSNNKLKGEIGSEWNLRLIDSW